MLDNLFLLSVCLFLSSELKNFFSRMYFIQLKEYRWDRIREFLKTREGRQGLALLAGPKILFLPLFLLYRKPDFFLIISFLVFSGLNSIFFLKGLIRGRKPRLTIRMILTLILFLGLFSLVGLSLVFLQTKLFFLDLFLTGFSAGLLTMLAVYFGSLPFVFVKKVICFLAQEKIKKRKDLTVVGITGSFGKTSTKEFIKEILKNDFGVLATNEHCNTAVGVAIQILKELKPKHKVYIVEMGAYRKGEIEEICKITRPKIGVITGINRQHLGLFGSFEKLLEAKGELAFYLGKEGRLVFNGEDENVLKIAQKSQAKKFIYSRKRKEQSDLWTEKVKVTKGKIDFYLRKLNGRQKAEVSFSGSGMLLNVLAAAGVGLCLGMDLEKLGKRIKDLRPLAGTMNLKIGKKGAYFIDDSYNANQSGIEMIFEHVLNFEKKKILVFQPLIELGNEEEKINRELLKKAGEIFDKVFLTNANLSLKKAGLMKETREKVTKVGNPREAAREIEEMLLPGDLVVFSGRESLRVLKHLSGKEKNV